MAQYDIVIGAGTDPDAIIPAHGDGPPSARPTDIEGAVYVDDLTGDRYGYKDGVWYGPLNNTIPIVVTQTGTSQSTGLGFTAVAGRIVVASTSARNWGNVFTPTGIWTKISDYGPNADPYPPAALIAGAAAGGETSRGGSWSTGGVEGVVALEVTGATLTGYLDGGQNFGNSGVGGPHLITIPSVTPTAGSKSIVLATLVGRGADTISTPAGFTHAGTVIANGGDWPYIKLYYSVVNNADGTPITITCNSSGDNFTYGATSAVLYGIA